MAKYGDCKYSTFKYGTGECGTQPVYSGLVLWLINIWWDGGWTNEASRCIGYSLTRGRRAYLAANGTTFEGMQPGSVTLTLDNNDGRFDTYNSSSPIYGHIKPGREVCIKAKDLTTGTIYPRFVGRISDIRPSPDRQTVTITAVDYLQWLYDQDITVTAKLNLKAHQAIGHVLDQAKYPYPRSLASSNLPIYIFDPADTNALSCIREVTDASLGTFFITNDGIARYMDVGSFGGDTRTIDQANLLKEITVTQPWESIRNTIKVTCTRRGMSQSPEILWSYGNPLYLRYGVGGITTIEVTHDEGLEINPVNGLDICAGPTPDSPAGTYSDFNVYAVRSNITKTGCSLRLSNTGAVDLYVNRLQIRGYKYYESQVPFKSTDASSISDYGPRRFNIDSKWLQDRGFGSAYATVLKDFLKGESKSPIVHLENQFADQFSPDLLDRIHLHSAKLGIDNTYDVGGITEEWLTPNGQGVKTTLYLQNILYTDTTPSAIPPEPYYPPLPPIPPPPPPVPPGGDPGKLPECKTSPTAAATGPYPLGTGLLTNATSRYQDVPVKYWFRPHYFTNATKLVISGKFLALSGSTWGETLANSAWAVFAIPSDGSAAIQGTIAGGGNTRTITFPTLTSAKYIDSLRFDFLTTGATSTGYIITGGLIKSITSAATNEAGITTTLEDGKYYAGFTSGEVHPYGDGRWTSLNAISSDGGTHWAQGGTDNASGTPWVVNTTLPLEDEIEAAQSYGDGIQTLWYFKMNGTSLAFKCWDEPGTYGDNTGSMSLAIYPAMPSGEGDKRIEVESMNLFNVCEV